MFAPLPTASLRLSDLFGRPYWFLIPDFQRPYSWAIKEAARLLEDLSGAAGIEDPDIEEPDYFLGAILLLSDEVDGLPKPDPALPPRTFGIVDGQQRMVTLTILLSALRDLLPDTAAETRAKLEVCISEGGTYRLELREGDQQFFAAHIQRADALETAVDDERLSDGERSLIAVRDHFRLHLSQLDPADRVRLADYIADRSHFVVILARGIDRAHRLFEVLNDRGKPLARNDILKAEVLRQCSEPQRAAVLAGWDQAAKRLGGEFEHLFSHIRVIYGHHRPQIIDGVRKVVREVGGPEAFVRSTLGPMSEALQAILSPDRAEMALDASMRDVLHQLGRLSSSEWVPMAMLALDVNRGDPRRALAALRAIDRFTHLSKVYNVVAHKRARRAQASLAPIAQRADFGPTQGNGPLQLNAEELRVVGYNLRDIHSRNSGIAKTILLRLNDAMAGSALRRDPTKLTVEHVLPQRPANQSEWRKLFPDGEERVACADCLGNLILISEKQNPRAKNLEFADKQRIYAERDSEPPLALNTDVIAARRWGPAEVRTREQKLLRLISEIWGVDYEMLLGDR